MRDENYRIKPKATKRCKPTHKKTIGFESCGEKKEHYKFGLCRDCYFKWLKSTPEGIETALKMIPRAKKKVEKEHKEKDKKAKVESKTIAVLKLEAKRPFQKLIRIRDYRKACICCPDIILPTNIGEYDAGHFKKAENYYGVTFHPDNVNGQRKYCNKHLDGNEAAYAEGLEKRIGKERFEALKILAIETKDHIWDRYELIELKKYYTEQLRLVEKGELDINDLDYSPGILSLVKTF